MAKPRYGVWQIAHVWDGDVSYETRTLRLNSTLMLQVVQYADYERIDSPYYSAYMYRMDKGKFIDPPLIEFKRIKGIDRAVQKIQDAAKDYLVKATINIPSKL